MMEIITKQDSRFKEYWQEYLDKNPHSLYYNLDYIEYLHSYCSIIKDLSFVIKKGDQILGICFLPIEEKESKSISLSGGYVPSPLSHGTKVEKEIFSIVHKLAQEHNISQIKMFTDPNLEFNQANTFNTLKRYDFIDTSHLNLTIDLHNTKEALWSNLSKSFKSLINKYTKTTEHTLGIMDAKSYSREVMDAFFKLHKEIAKENARDISLFEAQAELIQKGLASLIYIKTSEEYLSFSLFFHYNQFVTYASSVSKELKEHPPLSHFILWNASIHFQSLDYKLIQYGQPSGFSQVNGLDHCETEKELHIASFKRNMGAIATTLYRGISFYEPTLLRQHLDKLYAAYNENKK